MNDMLKMIAKQNMINNKFLQSILFYLGISEQGIKELLENFQEEVEKELEEN